MSKFLGFDIGATKTAWGVVDNKGTMKKYGMFPTPKDAETLINQLRDIIKSEKVAGIGVGVPGTVSADRRSTVLCANIPDLSEIPLAELLEQDFNIPVTVDNDARCALIGEVWQGAAKDLDNAVLVTLGTGIGGAVMQKGRVLPHPSDISKEIARISVDPTDVFPAKTGPGTVEAFLGGRNLEERFQINLHDNALKVREGDKEATEIWHAIAYYFVNCMKAIHDEYQCDTIIIGGIGSNNLEYYLQDPAPCTIVAATLREKAAAYGAARLAMDKEEIPLVVSE